jgi:hypothetical protein
MKEKDIEKFEKIQAQLKGLYNEISMLSKKAPNDGINTFKLKFINLVLSEANAILKEKSKPFNEFKSFEEDELPTNSDVTLILSQYMNCMEELRADNIQRNDRGYWCWRIGGEVSEKQTSPPKKLKGE